MTARHQGGGGNLSADVGLLSMYVAATQRLFRAQQSFLKTGDAKMPFIIGVAVRWRSANRRPRVCCKRCWRGGRTSRRSIS